jgi:dTMP kinase
MEKGLFIVFDGNDGSGKATQSRLLAESFAASGRGHLKLDFPAYDRNFFGAFLGECLAGQHGDFVHLDPRIASSLYALDRLESSQAISDALDSGKLVLADRFASSNQIHQGGKIADEAERIEFLAWLDRMEHEVLGIPRPDLIIYLDVPVETSLELLTEKRKAKNQTLGDGMKDTVEEDRQYLERSHATAQWLASRESNWRIVSCMENGALRAPGDIHTEARGLVEECLAISEVPAR